MKNVDNFFGRVKFFHKKMEIKFPIDSSFDIFFRKLKRMLEVIFIDSALFSKFRIKKFFGVESWDIIELI